MHDAAICQMTLNIGSESVPIQLAQRWFPALAISSAEIRMRFSNETHESNFIRQHSETVTAWNSQNADDCSFEKYEFVVLFCCNFPHAFVPCLKLEWHVLWWFGDVAAGSTLAQWRSSWMGTVGKSPAGPEFQAKKNSKWFSRYPWKLGHLDIKH